jgi:hypothetical protein
LIEVMVPPLNSRTQGSGLVAVPIAEVGLGKVFGALTEEVRFAQDSPLKTDSNLWSGFQGNVSPISLPSRKLAGSHSRF